MQVIFFIKTCHLPIWSSLPLSSVSPGLPCMGASLQTNTTSPHRLSDKIQNAQLNLNFRQTMKISLIFQLETNILILAIFLWDQLASMFPQGTCPVPRVIILRRLQSHSFPPGLSNSFTVLTVQMQCVIFTTSNVAQ